MAQFDQSMSHKESAKLLLHMILATYLFDTAEQRRKGISIVIQDRLSLNMGDLIPEDGMAQFVDTMDSALSNWVELRGNRVLASTSPKLARDHHGHSLPPIDRLNHHRHRRGVPVILRILLFQEKKTIRRRGKMQPSPSPYYAVKVNDQQALSVKIGHASSFIGHASSFIGHASSFIGKRTISTFIGNGRPSPWSTVHR